MLGKTPKTVKEYFKDFGRKGVITQRMLEENDIIRTVLTTEIGRDILFEDIQRFEDLLFRLIDSGFGYEKGQVNDDDLVEMRYLKKRINVNSKRIYQFLEAEEGFQNARN